MKSEHGDPTPTVVGWRDKLRPFDPTLVSINMGTMPEPIYLVIASIVARSFIRLFDSWGIAYHGALTSTVAQAGGREHYTLLSQMYEMAEEVVVRIVCINSGYDKPEAIEERVLQIISDMPSIMAIVEAYLGIIHSYTKLSLLEGSMEDSFADHLPHSVGWISLEVGRLLDRGYSLRDQYGLPSVVFDHFRDGDELVRVVDPRDIVDAVSDLKRSMAEVTKTVEMLERISAEPPTTPNPRMIKRVIQEALKQSGGTTGLSTQMLLARFGLSSGDDINYFCWDGSGWVVSYLGSEPVRLPNLKGLFVIAYLLSHPQLPVPSTYLARLTLQSHDRAYNWPQEPTDDENDNSSSQSSTRRVKLPEGIHGMLSGKSNMVLDERAMKNLANNLQAAKNQLEEAKRVGDSNRAALFSEHLTDLQLHARMSFNRWKQSRKFDDDYEKARKAVTASVRRAVTALSSAIPELGKHLRGALNCGHECCYSPVRIINWMTENVGEP
ncbi:MAG: hypothetical protein ACYDBB_08000 [Armatimonadota bacterium]